MKLSLSNEHVMVNAFEFLHLNLRDLSEPRDDEPASAALKSYRLGNSLQTGCGAIEEVCHYKQWLMQFKWALNVTTHNSTFKYVWIKLCRLEKEIEMKHRFHQVYHHSIQCELGLVFCKRPLSDLGRVGS